MTPLNFINPKVSRASSSPTQQNTKEAVKQQVLQETTATTLQILKLSNHHKCEPHELVLILITRILVLSPSLSLSA